MKSSPCLIIFLLGVLICIAFASPYRNSGTPPISCTRPHEEYQCGSACQTTCATLGQQCPIVNIKCNDACYCVEGYARNKAGVCIPIKKCYKDQSEKDRSKD